MLIVNEKNFKPQQDTYLIEPVEIAKQIGSIMLAEVTQTVEAYGKIIKCGTGKYDGEVLQGVLYKEGQTIFHVSGNGLPLTFQGKKYLLLREKDILGVIE